MNCDLAFDLMTDPQGTHSLALEEHLNECPRCRQMQATLAPALDWLQDPAEEPAGSLPWQISPAADGTRATTATAESLEIAIRSASALSAARQPASLRFVGGVATFSRYAAVALFAAALTILVLPREQGKTPEAGAPQCLRAEVNARRTLERNSAEIVALLKRCAECHKPSAEEPVESVHFALPIEEPTVHVAGGSVWRPIAGLTRQS